MMEVAALSAAEAEAALPQLAALLIDAVEGGASVGFLAGLSTDQAEAFWREQIAGVARGDAILFAAREDGAILGTVLLQPCWKPNQPHRADVAKLLVLRSARRRRIASALMEALEAKALETGRTLLTLDTETDSAAEPLYRVRGYVPMGIVPGHAMIPDGTLRPTTFFYKHLA
jgi:GNAT superfamily N-acetyltransferase